MSGGERPAKRRRRPPPETFVVSARVAGPMLDAIERVLDSGAYLRVSDYLREIIRRDLRERGLLPELGAEVEHRTDA